MKLSILIVPETFNELELVPSLYAPDNISKNGVDKLVKNSILLTVTPSVLFKLFKYTLIDMSRSAKSIIPLSINSPELYSAETLVPSKGDLR